jgi:hypothetical protein
VLSSSSILCDRFAFCLCAYHYRTSLPSVQQERIADSFLACYLCLWLPSSQAECMHLGWAMRCLRSAGRRWLEGLYDRGHVGYVDRCTTMFSLLRYQAVLPVLSLSRFPFLRESRFLLSAYRTYRALTTLQLLLPYRQLNWYKCVIEAGFCSPPGHMETHPTQTCTSGFPRDPRSMSLAHITTALENRCNTMFYLLSYHVFL